MVVKPTFWQMLGLWFHQRPTLIASVIEHTSMFCDSRLIRFHVKHAIASVTTGCLHTGMTEHEHVGSEGAQHSNIKTAVAWRGSRNSRRLRFHQRIPTGLLPSRRVHL